MIEYMMPLIGAIIVFIVLSIIPSRLTVKMAAQIVFISLLLVVLTMLLFSIYTFTISAIGFVVLLVFFSYIIGKQIEYSNEANAEFDREDLDEQLDEKEQQELEVRKEKVRAAERTKLDQEKIDQMLQENLALQEEKEPFPLTEQEGMADTDEMRLEEKQQEQIEQRKEIDEIHSFENEKEVVEENPAKVEEVEVQTTNDAEVDILDLFNNRPRQALLTEEEEEDEGSSLLSRSVEEQEKNTSLLQERKLEDKVPISMSAPEPVLEEKREAEEGQEVLDRVSMKDRVETRADTRHEEMQKLDEQEQTSELGDTAKLRRSRMFEELEEDIFNKKI